jgi:hypothetical protein
VLTLLIAFSRGGDRAVAAAAEADRVSITVGDVDVDLTRSEAAALADAIGAAVEGRREFVRTARVVHPDGRYEIRRRGADSAGNRKVFDGRRELRRLYERLPERFGADDVDHPTVSGSRRHLVVRHLAEHPAFDCELVRRRPLTVAKRNEG